MQYHPLRGRLAERNAPLIVLGDSRYESEANQQELRARGFAPQLAKRGAEHGSGLGVFRCVVERTISWLHQYRRLRVRWARTPSIDVALLNLPCILMISKPFRGSQFQAL